MKLFIFVDLLQVSKVQDFGKIELSPMRWWALCCSFQRDGPVIFGLLAG